MSNITDQEISAFERDGVVLIKNIFSSAMLDKISAAVDEIMEDPSEFSREYVKDRNGRVFTDHHMSRRHKVFHNFVMNSPASETAAALLKSDKLNLVDEHLLVKEPGTNTPTYWHHDLPYYEISWHDFASFWIPMDPVTKETGAMKFAKGSHLWGKTYKPIMIGNGKAAEGAADFDGPVPDIDATPQQDNVHHYEMDRGDALFFHSATLHAAEPNLSAGVRRRALSLRYGGSRATWKPRAYTPSRPDDPKLSPGSPLDGPDYPVIWRAKP